MPDAVPELILIVTDNSSVREEFEFGFGGDVDVVFARDARDAFEWLREQVPDAVVVDLQTGNAGGYSLSKEMRTDPRLASIPVVILLDRYQDAWLARQAGAHAFVVKPVSASGLLAEVVASLPHPVTG